MFRLNKKTDTISPWLKFGVHAPESHKNNLIVEMLSELSENDINLDCTDYWLNAEQGNLISRTLNLLLSIEAIDESISGYMVFDSAFLKEIVITSENYDKSIFDKITDKVMEYEDVAGREIDYYYVEKIIEVPESALKF